MLPGLKAERGRSQERLEASLAGLDELELLKQRQRSRVLRALRLGDSPSSSWEAPHAVDAELCGLRSQHSIVHWSPRAVKETLEQQVAELKMNTKVKAADSSDDLEDGHLHLAHGGKRQTGETCISSSTRRVPGTNAFGDMRDTGSNQEDYQQAQRVKTYIIGLIKRRVVTSRPSKPRTSLVCDVRPVGMLKCCKAEPNLPNQDSILVSSTPSQCLQGSAMQTYHNLEQEHYLEIEFTEEVPPSYDQLQQGLQDLPDFYHNPRPASMINTSRSITLEYLSCKVLQAHPYSSKTDLNFPQHLPSYGSPAAQSKPPSSVKQAVIAEYIPTQPCQDNRSYADHHFNPHNASGVPTPNQSTFSALTSHLQQEEQNTVLQIQPTEFREGPRKYDSNQGRSGPSRKLGKKACRSQSQNGLPKIPERKYNTVQREGGEGRGGREACSSQSKSKKQMQGYGKYQCQYEADQALIQTSVQGSSTSDQKDHCTRRTRKSRSTHATCAHPQCKYKGHHHYSHHHQHMQYQLERNQVLLCQTSDDYHPHQADSESSMSEADCPDHSSLSSDSDYSSGLVWPQQLPPQLPPPTPPAPLGAPQHPKAFVKIKASHALKKKILRFHTGSLKVMTTV